MVGRQRAVEHGLGRAVRSAPPARRTTSSSSASAAPTPSTACSMPCAQDDLAKLRLGTGPRGHQRPARLHAGGRRDRLPGHQRLAAARWSAARNTARGWISCPSCWATAGCTSTSAPASAQPDAANSIGGIPALKTREVETGVELRAGQTLAIAGLIEQHSRGHQPRSAVDQRHPLPGRALSLGQPSDQRGRAARARHAGDRRRHGARPGAGLPARHGDDQPQRLGTVLQGPFGSSQLLPGRRGRVPRLPASGGECGSQSGRRPDQPAESAESVSAANQMAMNPQPAEPGFIGPIGYDVLK